jgi:hypothetical protein
VRVVGPADGEAGWLGAIGVRFMIDGATVQDGGFSLVEHPMPPRALAAPLHKHTREDEYSYVVTGRMGALLGDDVVEAGPGDLVFKPRDQWHTFWNAGDESAGSSRSSRPPGFEDFFRELVRRKRRATTCRHAARAGRRVRARVRFREHPVLCERFGLRFVADVPPACDLQESPGAP